jgi:hypothetical protein
MTTPPALQALMSLSKDILKSASRCSLASRGGFCSSMSSSKLYIYFDNMIPFEPIIQQNLWTYMWATGLHRFVLYLIYSLHKFLQLKKWRSLEQTYLLSLVSDGSLWLCLPIGWLMHAFTQNCLTLILQKIINLYLGNIYMFMDYKYDPF